MCFSLGRRKEANTQGPGGVRQDRWGCQPTPPEGVKVGAQDRGQGSAVARRLPRGTVGLSLGVQEAQVSPPAVPGVVVSSGSPAWGSWALLRDSGCCARCIPGEGAPGQSGHGSASPGVGLPSPPRHEEEAGGV